ncbi:putative protein [Aquifex aeolicus VF5]|uniref:Uncharacterized protein aq_2157 n=1 Tax=Aquifex aeolicus (strain VF5) TaxID=224324 RepID=Y2157_AQUAE|nr:RecName: Full=Uncharacterized protein aq_2157 [Aquifex aeolicus VF5]AAC07885.1 putative protein [Aquifex aeolicus VF5]
MLVPQDYRIPFGIGYLLGTFFLSPDLDLHFSKPSQRWKFLKFLWFPFWVFSRHRGITHVPFLGTLVKLFYLIFIFFFLYFAVLGVLSILGFAPKELLSFDPFAFINEFLKSEKGFFFILGLIVADLLHIVLDIVSSFIKRF